MYQGKRLREQGRLIITLIISFVLLISCKAISSNTMDALYKSEEGRYVYAWNYGSGICIGICTRKPESIHEALTSVCNHGVKYRSGSSRHGEGAVRVKGFKYIVDVENDLAFLYDNTEFSSDAEEVCLSQEVLQNSERDGSLFVEEYKSTMPFYSRPEPTGIKNEEEALVFEKKYRIQSLVHLRAMSDGYVVVKSVQVKLTYEEAKNYCNTPDDENKKYVKDWNKVKLGGGVFKRGYEHQGIWTSNEDVSGDKIILSNGVKVSKQSRDLYTVCVTNIDNLQGVYTYRLPLLY